MRNAGLSHVHLLPSFHFAGVDDEKEKWKHIGESFSVFYPWFYILLTFVFQKFVSSNICNLFYLNALIVTLFFPCNVHTGSLLLHLELPLFVKARTISLYYKLRVLPNHIGRASTQTISQISSYSVEVFRSWVWFFSFHFVF